MRSDARKRHEPAAHHDPAVCELIEKARFEAWTEGYTAGVKDEVEAFETGWANGTPNPYRSAS